MARARSELNDHAVLCIHGGGLRAVTRLRLSRFAPLN